MHFISSYLLNRRKRMFKRKDIISRLHWSLHSKKCYLFKNLMRCLQSGSSTMSVISLLYYLIQYLLLYCTEMGSRVCFGLDPWWSWAEPDGKSVCVFFFLLKRIQRSVFAFVYHALYVYTCLQCNLLLCVLRCVCLYAHWYASIHLKWYTCLVCSCISAWGLYTKPFLNWSLQIVVHEPFYMLIFQIKNIFEINNIFFFSFTQKSKLNRKSTFLREKSGFRFLS